MKDTLLFIWTHYWFYFALAGLVLFFFVAIFLTACWEKHPIRQYQPGVPEEARVRDGLATCGRAARAPLGKGATGLQVIWDEWRGSGTPPGCRRLRGRLPGMSLRSIPG
jgi:hypothetical protein